jgi:hypothetical protein
VVDKALNGVKPHLLISDPPYGVDYDPSWRNEAGVSATARTGKITNDDRADWREAWALFLGDQGFGIIALRSPISKASGSCAICG